MEVSQSNLAIKPTRARSTSGCWTCRLRRKKCDETHPVCQTCAFFHIPCQGYGLRPAWMDRGPLEREAAQKIKATIAQGGQRKRRPGPVQAAARPRPLSPMSRSPNRAVLGTCLSNPTGPTTATGPTALASEPGTENDESSSHILPSPIPWDVEGSDVLSSLFPGEERSPLDFLILRDQLPGDLESPAGNFVLPNMDMFQSYNWLDSHPMDDEAFPLEISESVDDVLSRHADTNLASFLPGTTSTVESRQRDATEASGAGPGITEHLAARTCPLQARSVQESGIQTAPCSGAHTCPNTRGSGPTSSNVLAPEAAFLLSTYIDRAIAVHFPFRRRSRRSMHWQQFLLYCSGPVQELFLEISATHHAAVMNANHSNVSTYGDRLSHSRYILRCLPTSAATLSLLDNELKFSRSIVACSCLLQTIHLEMFLGGSHAWEDCLKQATPYMQLLIDTVVRAGPFAGLAEPSPEGPSQMQLAAARELLGHFIWLDIIASSTRNDGPLLGINPCYLLESNTIDMREVSGCPNSLAKALYEISALRTWKIQAESRMRMSIIELATRGNVILASINDFIDCPDDTLADFVLNEHHDSVGGRCVTCSEALDNGDNSCVFTRVFARTAIVYLHAVISGPNPHLPEIRNEVIGLIDLLQKLAAKGLMRYVPWPLCVTACFAAKEEKEVLVHSLKSDAEESSPRKHFRLCDEALHVAEECHRVREEEHRVCDWVLAMDNLNKRVLLG